MNIKNIQKKIINRMLFLICFVVKKDELIPTNDIVGVIIEKNKVNSGREIYEYINKHPLDIFKK